jgi:hypothetical protein
MENGETKGKPPYMSFQTFWNFIGELSGKPLPPQIDRSLMDTKSGTDQAHLTAAMKGFGLISDDLTVQPLLERLAVPDEDQRKKVLREIVEDFYAEPLKVSAANGTEKLLHDAFKDAYGLEGGDTRRKAVTFFLHAARHADVPLSPHFPQTRMGSVPSARPKRGKRTPKPAAAETPGENAPPGPGPSAGGDTYEVKLRCGGTVTLTVSVSHFALSRNREDRNFVNGLIDALTDYGEVLSVPAQPEEVVET